MLGFFNNATEVAELRKKVSILTVDNDRLISKIREIESQVDAAACEFVIDFTAIRCFSIERQEYGYTGKTLLGYNLLNDAENHGPREWILYCNEEQHQKLIDKFKLTKENNGTI